MGRRGPKGSPRLKLAAYELATSENVDPETALLNAGYKRADLCRAKFQAVSKQKNRIKNDLEKRERQEIRRGYYIKAKARSKGSVTENGSSISSVTNPLSEVSNTMHNSDAALLLSLASKTSDDIFEESIPTDSTALASRAVSNSTNTTAASKKQRKNALKSKLSVRDKILASNSRRTPSQVLAFMVEKNELDKKRSMAYEWAINEATKYAKVCIAQVARDASSRFDLEVKADTVRKIINRGGHSISRPGPKGKFTDDEMEALEVALLSFLALSQANCHEEKSREVIISTLQGIIQSVGQQRTLKDAGSFYRRVQRKLAAFLQLDKESIVEMRRQFWTTYPNLSLWYDGWEEFVVAKGFALKLGDEVQFKERAKYRICNLDETKLSLDGSDGGIGGRPCYTIQVKQQSFRTGTAANKASASSTLICGSNAAGEPMPIFVVFSSDAEHEVNFRVRADWLVGMPKVNCQFGNHETTEFAAHAIVNSRGGTDSRVLKEVLDKYTELLYPDAADDDDHRVIYKIDGGPGRLNLEMLAQLRCKGVYLYPGVPNTTHATQETDQNYSLFKSQLRTNVKRLTSYLANKYREQLTLHESNPGAYPYPKTLPSLSKSDYPRLVGGCEGEVKLLPAFQNAFNREHILRAWRVCGAVPLTRAALLNPSVRPVLDNHESSDDSDVVVVVGNVNEFDWKNATLLDLEHENKAACDKLAKTGINADALRLKAPRQVVALNRNRVSADASEEERVRAMADAGLSLSSIFYTVGSTSISSDEMMKAYELKRRREKWEEDKKERTNLLARKKIEEKGKECFNRGQPPRGWLVGDLRTMLRWKMPPDDYKNCKVSSASRETLGNLWEHWKDQATEDVIVPDEEECPDVIPELHETELGRVAQKNADVAVKSASKLSDEALASVISSLQEIERSRMAATTNMVGV